MPSRDLSLGVIFTGKVDPSFTTAINQIKGALDKLSTSTGKITNIQGGFISSLIGTSGKLKQYIQDVEKLLLVQARWYGARALLFAAVELPIQAIKNVATYAGEIDKARSEMLRWAATSGSTSQRVISDTDEIIKAIRKTTVEWPVAFADMSKVAQAFLGAGIKYNTVKEMIPDLAKLRTAFQEIDPEKFAVALTGFFKTFKDSIVEGATEAEKFKKILNSILAAQAEGIIRPEQFTKVLQYLGNISHMTGFSVDQMLALSVAVTDTGISASSAARTFAGLLNSIQSVSAGKILFEQFGIKIDKSKNLAEQFFNVIAKVKEKLGGGPITVGWAQALFSITSVEKARALAAIIEKLDTYYIALKKIEGASKGLDLAADIMKNNLPAQLTMLVTLFKELAYSIGVESVAPFRSFIVNLWEIGRGVLAAIDPTGVFTDKVDKFSDTSLKAYERTKDLVSILSSTGDILKGLTGTIWEAIKGWGILIDKLAAFKTILKIILDVYLAKLVWYLAVQIGPVLWKIITEIGFVFMSAETRVGLFGSALKLLTGPSGPIIILTTAIWVLNKAFDLLNENFDKMDAREHTFQDTIDNLKTVNAVRAEIIKKEEEIAKIKKRTVSTGLFVAIGSPTEEPYYGSTEEKKEALNTAKYELVTLKAKLKAIEKEIEDAKKKKKKTGEEPPSVDTGKFQYQSLVASAKQYANAMMQIKESGYQLEMASLQRQHERGLISEEEYYTERLRLGKEFTDYKLEQLRIETEEITKDYDKKLEKETSANKRRAIEDEKNAKLKQLEAQKIQTINHEIEQEAVDANTRELLAITLRMNAYEALYNLDLMKGRQAFDARQFQMEEEGKRIEWLYSNSFISVNSYYDKLNALSDSEYENKKKILEDEFNSYRYWYWKQLAVAGDNQVQIDKLNAERKSKEQKLTGDLNQLDEQLQSQKEQRRREESRNIEFIYSNKGAFGVIKDSLEGLVREYDKVGSRIKTMTESIAGAMASTFEDLFFDSMQGHLKDLDDYFKSFVDSMERAIAKFISDEITKSFITLLLRTGTQIGSWWGGGTSVPNAPVPYTPNTPGRIVTHTGGVIGKTQFPTKVVPDWLFNFAPRLHGGLRADEFPAILQRGETVIPANQQSGSNTSNHYITINAVDAASFVDLCKKHSDSLIGIVAKDFDRPGPMRAGVQKSLS